MLLIKIKLVLLCFILAYAQASDLRLSKSTKESSGCDLQVANFDTLEEFLTFFSELKTIAQNKDAAAFRKKLLFPIYLNGKEVKNLKAFNQLSSRLLTKSLYQKIVGQKTNELFCNSQGVMIGDGIIWIGKRNNQIGIITINNL